MFVLISPAKKLDFNLDDKYAYFTLPKFQDDIEELISLVKSNSKGELASLMHLSDKLAELNYDRYQKFSKAFTLDNAKQAIYAFQGDTYVGLDADSLSEDDIKYAQGHLGILSGLYGLLRPLDLMQPYRLEMGTKFINNRGKNLYEFWGGIITEAVNDKENNFVINLASNEYIKAIDAKKLKAEFITPHFKEMKNGVPKTIGVFAKRARGMMARYIIKNKITAPEDIKSFQEGDYIYKPEMSTKTDIIFIRGWPI